MTFMPASIAFRFDPVIVQNPPGRSVFCEQSFVTWSSPLRGAAEPAVANAATMTTARSNPKIAFAVKLLRCGECSSVMTFSFGAESGAARLGVCGLVRIIGSLSLGGVGGWFPLPQSHGKVSRLDHSVITARAQRRPECGWR